MKALCYKIPCTEVVKFISLMRFQMNKKSCKEMVKLPTSTITSDSQSTYLLLNLKNNIGNKNLHVTCVTCFKEYLTK